MSREAKLKQLKKELAQLKDELEFQESDYERRVTLEQIRRLRNARASIYRNK